MLVGVICCCYFLNILLILIALLWWLSRDGSLETICGLEMLLLPLLLEAKAVVLGHHCLILDIVLFLD